MKLFYNISSVHPWNDTRIYFRQAFSLGETGMYKVKHIAVENNLIPDNIPANIEVELLTMQSRKRRMLNWIALYRKIKKDKPDVIQFHDPELLILMNTIRWIPRYHPVIVYDMHENVPKVLMRKKIPEFALSMYRYLERQLLRACNGVVFAESTYKEDYRFLTCPTMDVYNYPKVPFMKENEAKEDVFTFIYLGGISDIRGGETMLLLAKRLVDLKKKFHMKIIGTGSEEYIGKLNTFIFKNNLEGHISLEGAMAFDKAFESIQKAHVGMAFLVPDPNFMGGKTTKCFEYMAAGIPFMVSDFLIQNVLDKWECGVSVDVANMDEMVQKAVYLLESPEMATNMGERGKAAYRQEYNWENEEGKLLSLFDKIGSCS
ncbi:glycosyltransferase family protein [Peribacillus sp. NPDC097895]|uniref:glycosyltransferase family protein n=1 Tax=Peribacillus sp. NPDC097895 TaxID=3390619 RepID=UPI003CFC1E40